MDAVMSQRSSVSRMLSANKAARIYLASVAVILITTAGLKLVSIFSDARLLLEADPLLSFLTNRQVILLSATTELVILGLICGGSFGIAVKLAASTWLGAIFVIYRLGIWWIGAPEPCKCLGTLTRWIQVEPSTSNLIAKWLLAYLLIGSVAFLTVERLASRGNHLKPRKA